MKPCADLVHFAKPRSLQAIYNSRFSIYRRRNINPLTACVKCVNYRERKPMLSTPPSDGESQSHM